VIKSLKRLIPAAVLALASMGVVANQDIQIEQQVTLAVDQQLKMPDGSALSIVKTEPLFDGAGNILKGRHQLFFTNRVESTIPVVVNDVTVVPGQTVEFTVNLSLSSNRLYFPIYPAVAGAAGEIYYDINLPSLSITDCPTDFSELPSGACQKVELSAGEYVCPETYTTNGMECLLERVVTINSACPIDYALIDGECVKEETLTAMDSCEAGFRLNESGQCEQNVIYPMEYTCPDGYALDANNACKRTYSIEPGEECPATYTRVDEQCERVLDLAVASCEAGFALQSGECFELKVPLDVCPHGYTQNGEACELIEAATPQLDCPSGYALNADNQCVDRTEILVSGVACPPDAINDNGTCKKIEYFEQQTKCGTGQFFDGSKCIDEQVVPIAQCQEGWVLIDGNCYERHGYELICPDGFSYADDHCERVVVVNKQQCPDGYTFNESEQNCYKTVVGNAIESCPIDYALIDGQCQREFMLEADSCSAGHVLKNGRCYDITLVNYICPEGYSESNGQCEKVSITDIASRCPDQYQEVNGQCEKLIITDAVQSCALPEYYIENEECLKVTELASQQCEEGYTQIDGLCYRTQEPMYYCENDFVLSEDNTTCTKVQVKDVFQTCPEEFENIGGVCERRSTITPELECPVGYEPANDRCEKQVSTVASQCPQGALYKEDGTCAFVSELSLSCPSGLTLKGSQCFERVTSDRDTCKSGYIYENGQCFEVLDKEKVCSAGQEVVEVAGSMMCKDIEETTFCADGYYFDGTNCVNTDSQQQTRADYCPAGFVYSNENGVERCVSDENLTLTLASLSCPEGSNPVSASDCLSLCPEGYQDANGTCEKVTTTAYEQEVCLEGTLQNGKCWNADTGEVGLKGFACPSGTKNASPYSGDSSENTGFAKTCLGTDTTSKQEVCMSDLGITGPACLSTSTRQVVSAEVCPDGMSVNNAGQCVVVEDAQLACNGVAFNGPASRTVDSYVNDDGACVSYVEVEQQEAYECPVGFKPVYNYDGHALPTALNPTSVVSDNVSSDVLAAFQTQWSSLNFISSNIEDEHQVAGTPRINDFLCVSDTVTLIEADLGVTPEQTFNAIFEGTQEYGIDGVSLVDNVSNMSSRYQNDYVSALDGAGEIYNYEFLQTISRSAARATINGFVASLAVSNESALPISAPGSEEVKEFIKLYPVKGFEDKFIIASMLLVGNVEGENKDARDYVARIIEKGQPSAIDLVQGCSLNDDQALLKNIGTYNTPLADFIADSNGFVLSTEGNVNRNGEEACYIIFMHKGAQTKTCPEGMTLNGLGQCQSVQAISGAQSCETVSDVRIDYKCPVGMNLSNDGLTCTTKAYTPAYSCELGQYDAETGLCVQNAECEAGYEVRGEFCTKRLDCDVVLGLSNSYYDADYRVCRNANNGEPIAAVPECPEGEEFDPDLMMCKAPYEVSTVAAELACPSSNIEGDQCVTEKSIPSSASKTFELAQFNQTSGSCDTTFVQSHDVSEIYCESAQTPLFLNGNWYCAENEPALPAMPVCPSGYVESNNNDSVCIKETYQKPVEQAQAGSMLLSGVYVSTTPTDAALECGFGKVWNGTNCESFNPSAVSPNIGACEGIVEYRFDETGFMTPLCQTSTQNAVCEAGYSMGEEGVCERIEIHEVTNICPDDYTFDGTHCQRLETADVVYSCPESMTMILPEEGCISTVEKPSVIQCPEGETLQNGVCINTDTDDFTAICDAPFTYDAINNNCRLEEIEPIVYACPPNQVLNGYTCEELLVEPTIEECPSEFVQDGQCRKVETIPMISECPLGYADEGANCVSTTDNASAVVCPNGSTQVAGTSTCSTIDKVSVIYSCPSPYDLKNGNECHRVDIESSKDECPTGYRLTENGRCERVTIAAGSTFCASGFTYDNQTKRCERLVETSVASCPENYLLQSGSCYPLYTSSLECPANYTLDTDGRCVNDALTPLDTLCPSGWRAGGNGQCYQMQTTGGSKVCPSGYYMQDGVCVEDVFTDINGCPEGYSFSNGECRETSPVLYDCPDGWDTNGAQCERTLVKPVSSCPSGYVKQGDFCHAVQPADESCPSGYTNGNDGTCYRNESTFVASCPSGYVKQGNYCHRVIDAAENCPAGYTNGNDGKCYNEQATSIASCPSGYVLQNGFCHRVVPANMSCPSGYTRSGTTCTKTDSIPATASCPSGYTRSGSNCTKTETVPAQESCPSGYTISGSNCVRIQTQSPTLTCPSGYSRSGSTCTRTTTYSSTKSCSGDLTYNSSTQQCEGTGTTEPTSVGCFFGSQPQYDPQNDIYYCENSFEGMRTPANVSCPDGTSTIEGGNCYTTKTEEPNHSCPSGGSYTGGGTCTRTQTTSATQSCPSGYTLKSGTCRKSDSTPVTYTCPSGYTFNGTNCTRTLSQPVAYSCPAGYSRSGTTCTRTQTTSVTYSCSSGYSIYNTNQCKSNSPTYSVGNCPSGYSLNTSTGQCERTLEQNVTYSCPSGYGIYNTDQCKRNNPTYSVGNCPSGGYSLNTSNGKCDRTLTQPVTYFCSTSGYSIYQTDQCKRNSPTYSVGSCPSGYVQNNSTGYCERDENQPATEYCLTGSEVESINCPTQTCDPGYTLSNGQCIQVNEYPINSCDSGFTKIGNDCFRLQPIQYQCPAGYQLENGQCVSQAVEQGQKTCSAGYALVNGSCYQLYDKVAACPSGYQLQSGLCKREVSRSPIGCKDGYVADGPSCREIVEETVTCPENATYNAKYNYCIETFTAPAERDPNNNWFCPEGRLKQTGSSYRCIVDVFVEPTEISCPSNASLVGDVCASNYSDGNGIQCPTGSTYSQSRNTCVETDSRAPTEQCPSGTVSYSSSQCRKNTAQSSAMICSSNSTFNPSTGQCEVEATAEPTESCNNGYVPLNSSQCRASNSTLSAGNCPSGMTLQSDGYCDQVRTRPTVNNCPDGATGTISQCRSTTGTDVGLCPTGYTYSNGRCVDTREYNGILSCPDTHFFMNGGCYPMTVKYNTCPSGYSLNGQQCERVGSTNVATNCRAGFVKSNGQCVKETKRSFVNCQSGYALSNDGPLKTCHKVVDSQPVCPPNQGLVDGMCKSIQVQEVEKVCYDGYSQLNSTTCFKDLFTPRFFGCPVSHPEPYLPNRTMCTDGSSQVMRQPTCAEGTVYDAGQGMCRERLTKPIITQCPLDFTPKNGECVKEIENYPLDEVSCPTGYVSRIGQEEECRSVASFPEAGICPTGTAREGEGCVNTETFTPQQSCPSGFAKVGDSCVRTLVSEVNKACVSGGSLDLHYCRDTSVESNLGFSYLYNCPSGYKARGQSCYRLVTRSIDSICAAGQVITPEGCRAVNEVAHVDACPSGQTLVSDGVCRSNTAQNGAVECADGYVSLSNGRCYRLDWQAPSVTCSVGERQGLECYDFEEVIATPDCPYGFQFNGSQCQKVEIENIEKVCKNEFGVLDASFCRETFATNIQADCGPNAYFSVEVQSCVEREELPRGTACPTGMTFNQDTGFCQRVTVLNEDPLHGFVCPSGYWYETQRGICVSYQESAANTLFNCPAGYSIHHNECRRTQNVSASYNCPADTVLVDGPNKMCAYTALDLNLGVCPTGFSYNASMRICTSDERIKAEATCPQGTMLNASGTCLQVIDTKPIIKDCTAPYKDVEGYFNCVEELTAVATPSCPTGYVYHTGIAKCVDENFADTLIVCENGYALNAENARCERLVTTPVDKQCDDRFVLSDGQCVAVLPNESVALCDDGYLYDPASDQCVQHQVTEIFYTCPADYAFDDAKKACVRTDTQDGIEDCPTGFVLTDDKTSCVNNKEVAATPACPDNYELDGSQCRLVIKKSPTTECPTGFNRRGENECVLKETSTAITSCPEGFDFIDGSCVKTEYKPVERCAAGYTVLNGGCFETDLATFSCPDGTRLSRNEDGDLLCRFYQTTTSTISCAVGKYNWAEKRCEDDETQEEITEDKPMCLPAQMRNGNYVQGQFNSSTGRCEHQMDYDAMTYINECSGDLIPYDEIYCRSVTADNSKAIGPFGFVFDDLTGYFKKEVTSAADLACYDGFSLRGDSCEKEIVVEPTASTCPDGFSLTGVDTCEQNETLDALFICPEGYVNDGNNNCSRTIILPSM